jgi:D-alanyl-lipoteichoic acid acyltransferase DltB (MBOAT superfamily)
MLFNSFEFLSVFLPIVVVGFLLLRWLGSQIVLLIWLIASSLFYYGWWDWRFLWLIGASILVNYVVGQALVALAGPSGEPLRKPTLIAGIVFNLAVLGYFKYFNFFLDNLSTLTGHNFGADRIILPIGLSFITFQKIAFLVDVYQRKACAYSLPKFALFVTFFPQLIAGPVTHHKEIISQFNQRKSSDELAKMAALGVVVFIIGLFKKVVIADSVAEWSTPVFKAADAGQTLNFLDAWTGILAYTFQIYFDFSGYSEMAIGLGLLFGISLPINFNSPYKATSIIDFWKCWHMTLSRFLRDYLYVPLGGNRKGRMRRHGNLMITMLLGGLWHGAGWNFIIWGGLHGLYLVVNHSWRTLKGSNGGVSWVGTWTGRLFTFGAVVVAWTFFRAGTLDGALQMLNGMSGLNEFVPKPHWAPQQLLVATSERLLALAALLAWIWFAPPTIALLDRPIKLFTLGPPRLSNKWRPIMAAIAASLTLIYLISLISAADRPTEFLYFQF